MKPTVIIWDLETVPDTLGALLAPAPATNFLDARAIRATSQKLQPPSPLSGFFSSARTPLCRSRTDREIIFEEDQRDAVLSRIQLNRCDPEGQDIRER